MKRASTKINETQLLNIYEMYNDSKISVNQFRRAVVSLISDARAPNYTLINQMDKMRSKDSLLISFNNFVQKGHGYGV